MVLPNTDLSLSWLWRRSNKLLKLGGMSLQKKSSWPAPGFSLVHLPEWDCWGKSQVPRICCINSLIVQWRIEAPLFRVPLLARTSTVSIHVSVHYWMAQLHWVWGSTPWQEHMAQQNHLLHGPYSEISSKGTAAMTSRATKSCHLLGFTHLPATRTWGAST